MRSWAGRVTVEDGGRRLCGCHALNDSPESVPGSRRQEAGIDGANICQIAKFDVAQGRQHVSVLK